MRRATIGWLGGGLAAALALAAGACGSKGNGSSSNTGGNTGTAGASSSTGTSSGTGGTTSSSSGTGGTGGTGGTTASSSSGSTSTSSSSGNPMAGDSVLMHHKNPSRDGLYVQPTFTKAAIGTLHKDTAFAPTGLQGAVYAQPLFVDGGPGGKDLVIVATEGNNVYALDASNGSTVWTKNLGTPVALSHLPCGNIDPFGVTGTPVIDLVSRTIYVDAETTPDNGTTKHHQVFALSLDTGVVKTNWPVDVAAKAKAGTTTFNPSPQGQRGALALLNGTLYIPFGGRYGDCGNYHGWVVAISTTDPTQVQAFATSLQGGGIWSPNGIATDGTNLFVSTGNTFGANNVWGGGNAVLRLTPGATFGMSAYFAPKNWQQLDNSDQDLGTGPIVFDLPGSTPSALAIAFGKDGNAYLLDRNNLGGVSNSIAQLHVASNEIISAPALYTTATATYVVTKGAGSGCASGSGDLLAVQVVPGSPPTLKHAWCAKAGAGSPIVTTSDGHADAIVWNLGAEGDGFLHAFDGDMGTVISFTDSTKVFSGMRRYNTPIAAKGRIFVPVDGANGGVIAFKL